MSGMGRVFCFHIIINEHHFWLEFLGILIGPICIPVPMVKQYTNKSCLFVELRFAELPFHSATDLNDNLKKFIFVYIHIIINIHQNHKFYLPIKSQQVITASKKRYSVREGSNSLISIICNHPFFKLYITD